MSKFDLSQEMAEWLRMHGSLTNQAWPIQEIVNVDVLSFVSVCFYNVYLEKICLKVCSELDM